MPEKSRKTRFALRAGIGKPPNNPARFGGHHQGKDVNKTQAFIAGIIVGAIVTGFSGAMFLIALTGPLT